MYEEKRKCPPLKILSFTNNSGGKKCLQCFKTEGKNVGSAWRIHSPLNSPLNAKTEAAGRELTSTELFVSWPSDVPGLTRETCDQHHQASAGSVSHVSRTGSWRSALLSVWGWHFVRRKTTSVDHPTPPRSAPPHHHRSAAEPAPASTVSPHTDRHGGVVTRHARNRSFRLHPVLRPVVYALHVHHLRVSLARKLSYLLLARS